jgi:pantothenate kinase type III
LADQAGVAPDEVRAILTGGLSAAPWASALEGIDAIDPQLTLRGLAILHAEVTGGQRLELGLP